MLRTVGKLGFTFALAAAFAAPAHAQRGQGPGQGRGMGMMGRGGGLMVLANPAGQKELNLTDEQNEKISEVMQNMQADMREKMSSLGEDLAPEERMQKAQGIMRELTASAEGEVKDILKPEQFTRYQEIKLQSQGLDALNDPDVAKKLELTDEQKEKLASLQTETREKTMEIMQAARDSGDMQGAFAKMQEARDAAMTDAMDLLTDSQKETWSKMTGKPFKMEPFGGAPRRRQID